MLSEMVINIVTSLLLSSYTHGLTSILLASAPGTSGMMTSHSNFPAGGGGTFAILLVVEN